jgi:hypothetical protein
MWPADRTDRGGHPADRCRICALAGATRKLAWRCFAVSIIGGIPAAGAMEGVRHAARNSPVSGTGGRQVTVLIRLRGLLQRLLSALGALVALWTFTFGAAILLQRHLEAGSAQGHVTVYRRR